MRSTRPRSSAPGEFGAQRGRGAEHLHQQPVGLGGQLGAENLRRRRVGRRRCGVLRGGQLPVDQLEHLGFGMHASEVELHPLGVDQPVAVHVLGVLRPFANAVEGPKIGWADTRATRSWLSWLVTSFQPAFSSPTRLVGGTRNAW